MRLYENSQKRRSVTPIGHSSDKPTRIERIEPTLRIPSDPRVVAPSVRREMRAIREDCPTDIHPTAILSVDPDQRTRLGVSASLRHRIDHESSAYRAEIRRHSSLRPVAAMLLAGWILLGIALGVGLYQRATHLDRADISAVVILPHR